jgi:methionyl aminopeptidase
MVNVGSPRTKLMDDGWTVKTADGKLSAHSEHSIAITDNGPEILTLP